MNFEFAYAFDFGTNLDYDGIALTCGLYSRMADEATGGDRSAWGAYVHQTEIGIGFRHERDRDRFVENYQYALWASGADKMGETAKRPARRSSRRSAVHRSS